MLPHKFPFRIVTYILACAAVIFLGTFAIALILREALHQ
jgi:hypothetical protein